MVFSVVAGANLWLIRPKAIAIVRAYFIFVAVFEIYAFIYDSLYRHNVEYLLALRIRSLIVVVIWALYFRLSRRVKNTYGTNI